MIAETYQNLHKIKKNYRRSLETSLSVTQMITISGLTGSEFFEFSIDFPYCKLEK